MSKARREAGKRGGGAKQAKQDISDLCRGNRYKRDVTGERDVELVAGRVGKLAERVELLREKSNWSLSFWLVGSWRMISYRLCIRQFLSTNNHHKQTTLQDEHDD